MSHEEFASRYHFFTMAVSGERPDAVEMCRRIVNIHGKMGEEIRVGQSQVYATEQGIELVERWKHRVRNQAAVLIQQWWRELVRRRAAAILLQDWWRSVRRSRAATRLQNWWRIKFYRKRTLHKVAKISRSVLVIQRSVRRWIQSRKKPLPSTNTHLHLAEETPPPSPLPPETTATTKICLRTSPQRTVIRPLSLHLSRSDWFYSDGIVSIRRPAAVKCLSHNPSMLIILIEFYVTGVDSFRDSKNLFALFLHRALITVAQRIDGCPFVIHSSAA